MRHNQWLEVPIDKGHTGPSAKLLVACSAFCWHCTIVFGRSSHSTSVSCVCRWLRNGVTTGLSAIKPVARSSLGDVCGTFTRPAAPSCTASYSQYHSAAAATAHPVCGVAGIGTKPPGHLSFTFATAAQHTTETGSATFWLPWFRLLKPLGSCFGNGWAATANGSILFIASSSHVEPTHNTTKQATGPRARSALATLQCYALQNVSKHLRDGVTGKG